MFFSPCDPAEEKLLQMLLLTMTTEKLCTRANEPERNTTPWQPDGQIRSYRAFPINPDQGARRTLLPTYLRRAGAPRAQKKGPGCFSRPSAQVSAFLDALFLDHFGAGETTAGAKPRNPCVLPFKYPEGEKMIKITFWGWRGKKKSYTKTSSQVLEMLGGRAVCASEMRAHVCRRCLLPLLRSGWVCTPRCSPPPSTVIGHILGTGAVGKQRQQSSWAMLSVGWVKKKKSWGCNHKCNKGVICRTCI